MSFDTGDQIAPTKSSSVSEQTAFFQSGRSSLSMASSQQKKQLAAELKAIRKGRVIEIRNQLNMFSLRSATASSSSACSTGIVPPSPHGSVKVERTKLQLNALATQRNPTTILPQNPDKAAALLDTQIEQVKQQLSTGSAHVHHGQVVDMFFEGEDKPRACTFLDDSLKMPVSLLDIENLVVAGYGPTNTLTILQHFEYFNVVFDKFSDLMAAVILLCQPLRDKSQAMFFVDCDNLYEKSVHESPLPEYTRKALIDLAYVDPMASVAAVICGHLFLLPEEVSTTEEYDRSTEKVSVMRRSGTFGDGGRPAMPANNVITACVEGILSMQQHAAEARRDLVKLLLQGSSVSATLASPQVGGISSAGLFTQHPARLLSKDIDDLIIEGFGCLCSFSLVQALEERGAQVDSVETLIRVVRLLAVGAFANIISCSFTFRASPASLIRIISTYIKNHADFKPLPPALKNLLILYVDNTSLTEAINVRTLVTSECENIADICIRAEIPTPLQPPTEKQVDLHKYIKSSLVLTSEPPGSATAFSLSDRPMSPGTRAYINALHVLERNSVSVVGLEVTWM